MHAFRICTFITGLLPPYVLPNKNRLLKNWPFFTNGFWMAPFSSIDFTSLVTSKDSCADIFGLCGTFSWNVSKMKSIFRLDTHTKISGFLSIFYSVLQNIAALLLEENCWLLHLEIGFAPLGVYALTGVLELFLVSFHLELLEEQLPWYIFLLSCVFF